MEKQNTIKLAIATGLFIALTQPAFAAKCKKVETFVENNRSQEIKIVKLEYFDTDVPTWRSENFTNWKIASNSTEKSVKGLEHVRNQTVQTRLKWKYNTGGSQWSTTRTTTGPTIYCTEGEIVEFTIN